MRRKVVVLRKHRESERNAKKKVKSSRASEREKVEVATSGMKERALQYASLGLPVLPFYTCADGACTCGKGKACERPGKHPMTAHGVKDATTNLDQIEKWWSESPNANIGMATGPEVEAPRPGRRSQERRRKDLCQRRTGAWSTSGNCHCVFRWRWVPFAVPASAFRRSQGFARDSLRSRDRRLGRGLRRDRTTEFATSVARNTGGREIGHTARSNSRRYPMRGWNGCGRKRTPVQLVSPRFRWGRSTKEVATLILRV